MKKLLGIVLSAAMLLSMAAGCSKVDGQPSQTQPPNQTQLPGETALLHPAQQQILPLTLPLLPMQLPAT